jgi:putative glutamine amidotransferase
VTRPAIGITIGYDGRRRDLHTLRQDYVLSVERGGGLPLVLVPGSPADVGDVLGRIDGLVLSGGSDIDPSLYGETPHPKLGRVIRERDDFELALCREALRRDLPILAICRGHQVLNVATGGTLIQDIPSEVSGRIEHDARRERWERAHDVRILQGTRLGAILRKAMVAVNSFHHQAVERVGDGLIVSACSADEQVVEGIEMPDRRFVLGVQWHPESFWNRPDGFSALFEALVAEATRP